MAKTRFINARIDGALKDEAEKIFSQVGISSSQALTMFYRQVVLRHGMPFEVRVEKSPRYTLDELLAQCDPKAPISKEEREWLDTPRVGRELI
jgi:addiction module RelB/DinJ family antitoxin